MTKCPPNPTLSLLLSLAVSAVAGVPAAYAQFNNGAVIVTVPTDNSAPAAKPTEKPTPALRGSNATPAVRKRRAATRRRPRRRPAPVRRTSADKVKIAILVNDDPITEYEITQRAEMIAGAAGGGIRKQAQAAFQGMIKRKSTSQRLRQILKETIDANRGKSRQQIIAIFERRKKAFAISLQRQAFAVARKSVLPGLRRKASDELIEQRLKIQAAKKAKALISDSRLEQIMTGIAKRNKMTMAGFKQQLARQGTDIHAFRERIRAQASWGQVINAKFGHFIDVNQKTIDESVITGRDADRVSLKLVRITLRLPDKIDQRIMAQRMIEAEQIRAGFTGCDTARNLSRGIKNISFQDLGFAVASSISEPTRSLLLNSNDNTMIPPLAEQSGVALYAVCGRRSGSKSLAAREAAVRNLRQQGMEVYGRKYLSDLRREAHIEYRNK